MTFQTQEQYQFIESILFENLGYNPEILDFNSFMEEILIWQFV
jgi:hypothetical protein